MSDAQPNDPRGDAYDAALLEAWFATRMEKDRTLLALSAGGVALVATLLTTVGAKSVGQLSLLVLSALAFLVAITAGVRIFALNADYLEREKRAFLDGGQPVGEDAALVRLDRVLAWSFSAGVLITIVGALLSAWPLPKESAMAESTPRQNPPMERSLSGASGMRPGEQPAPQSSGQQQGGGTVPSEQGQGSSAPPAASGEQ
jgi:hypothetical protein